MTALGILLLLLAAKGVKNEGTFSVSGGGEVPLPEEISGPTAGVNPGAIR